MYIRIRRNIFYCSYKLSSVWGIGIIISTGQISYWGATVITNLLFLISVTQLFHELDFAIKKRGDILKACTKNRIFFLLPDKIAKRFLSFSFLSRCAQRAGFNLLGRDSGECIRQDLRCLSLYCSKLYGERRRSFLIREKSKNFPLLLWRNSKFAPIPVE